MTDGAKVAASRALVTGAGGFIGSHLTAELLRRGGHVFALDRNLDRLRHLGENGRLVRVEGDLVDPASWRDIPGEVDTVYHLAAAHLGVTAGASEFLRTNVEGTRALAQAAAAAGFRRFVHCSSVGVYGRIDAPPADEETPCRPRLVYEKTKLAGEQVVLECAAKEGLAAVVLRPVWVYGPGCPRTEKLFRAIGKGRFVVAGAGDRLRHCVYIRDAIEALCLAAVSDRALGRVIIVGDRSAVTVRHLVDQIAQISGARPPRSVPLSTVYLAALAAEAAFRPLGKEPPLSRRSLEFFRSNTSFRIARAKSLLGFEPSYDLFEGLSETYDLLQKEARSLDPIATGATLGPTPESGAPASAEALSRGR